MSGPDAESAMENETHLKYDLPATVKSICEGWLSTLGSAAIVSSLLAAVEASLVAFFKDDDNFKSPESKAHEAILILTYTSIILSIGATISALTLTDQFGEIHSRASRKRAVNENPKFAGGDWDLLLYYQAGKSTRWIVYHWLICLLVAGVCAICSITTYAVTQEEDTTRIVILVVTFIATVPPFFATFFAPLWKRLEPLFFRKS